jgi:AAA15 family ATPase/GTPase
MQDYTIRIQEIELSNFKNIKYGKIALPSYLNKNSKPHNADIVGLYGQNGSGKTALVDAMWILKHALIGNSLPTDTREYIQHNANASEIGIVFHLQKDVEHLIFYNVEIMKKDDDSVRVSKEKLSYKKLTEKGWTSKSCIIDYDFSYAKKDIFYPKKSFSRLSSEVDDLIVDLNVSKKLSDENITSFIFREESFDVFKKSQKFKEFTEIMIAMRHYAVFNLFIFRSDHTRMISMNLFLPFKFRFKELDKITSGELGIPLLKPTVVPVKIYTVLKKILKQMNIVLATLIPELNVSVLDYGEQLLKNGDAGIRIELVSVRGEVKIPLRYESDGIRKIISMLSTIIIMYNSPSTCLVIDELDAGVFEYLLGEMLQIISQKGKGQLIFSSHNLRPLEMLDTNLLVFTTTNPENRYIRFANVKTNHNLRNLYYRSICLDGQKEIIYEKTDKHEISRAFRIAGKELIKDEEGHSFHS